jgi:hypothetical protein
MYIRPSPLEPIFLVGIVNTHTFNTYYNILLYTRRALYPISMYYYYNIIDVEKHAPYSLLYDKRLYRRALFVFIGVPTYQPFTRYIDQTLFNMYYIIRIK